MLPLLILTMAMCHAQNGDAAAKAKAPPRSLRLLPLGEAPPFRQEVRDGVRYELEPAPGSVPPRQVRLGDVETSVLVRLNLGRASEKVRIPAGTEPAIFREANAPADSAVKPWLSLNPPEAGDVLAVIWRDPGTRWTQPRSLLFPDSGAALPAGSIRIVNLLPSEAALVFDEDRILLPPGKSMVKAIAVGTDLPIQIAFKTNTGKYQPFHSSSVLLNPNERAQIFIHRADGEKPRQAAKVVIIPEAAPPPPKPSHSPERVPAGATRLSADTR